MAVREMRPTPTWRGRPLAELNDQELSDAAAFSERACEVTREHAPKAVWAFFASALSDLTVEQARRLAR